MAVSLARGRHLRASDELLKGVHGPGLSQAANSRELPPDLVVSSSASRLIVVQLLHLMFQFIQSCVSILLFHPAIGDLILIILFVAYYLLSDASVLLYAP